MSAEKHKASQSKLDPTRMNIPWEQSSDAYWQELEQKLEQKLEQGTKDPDTADVSSVRPVFSISQRTLAMAASLLLLAAIGSFMRFYTRSYSTPAAVRTAITLPDNSSVELNAESKLSYHPLWWWAGRKVKLEGEAFFSVQKGSDFRVTSGMALTEVLGTSFNIRSREQLYEVSCHSGRVRVSERSGDNSVILEAHERTTLLPGGHFESGFIDPAPRAPWTQGMASFTATSLALVLEEIERQFDIEITTNGELDQLYSGQFSMEQPLDNILSLICIPFGLQYEHLEGNLYHITP